MACNKCNDVGYIINALGMKIKCSCKIESPIKEKVIEVGKPSYHVTEAQKEVTVTKKLIPDARANDEFDEQFIKNRLTKMCKAQDCKIMRFAEYTEALNEIIVGISIGTLNKSYLIGAPNGFGKTTFANTCIKRLDAMGKKAVPYISLFEIGALLLEYEKKIMGAIDRRKEIVSENEDEIIYEYKWEEYMKSDVLFTYLTTLERADAEVKLLKEIIQIRGPKGLPTVVFTDISMMPYFNNKLLKKIVWDEILAYSYDAASPDRLLHVSCFKIYNSAIKAKAGEDY